MTNFAVQSTLGATAPLVSKDKGSVGNRMNCAGSHIANDVVSGAQALAVGGTAYGATRLVLKSNGSEFCYRLATGLSKVFDGGIKLIGKLSKNPAAFSQKINEYMQKIIANGAAKEANNSGAKFIKAVGRFVPKITSFKALAVIAGLALPALAYIAHNHTYKAGQIDQKYTDRAKTEKLAA